jgi:hypothetical protein
MYPEVVIGFDCRQMPNSLTEQAITIDRTRLNTIFNMHFINFNGRWIGIAPGYMLEIPFENCTVYKFCDNLNALQKLLKTRANELRGICWVLALSVVQGPNYQAQIAEDSRDRAFTPVGLTHHRRISTHWKHLGYDVQDNIFWEGLGYESDRDELQRAFSEAINLNQYELFDHQEQAVHYANWLNRYESHKRFFAYGIYLVEVLTGK